MAYIPTVWVDEDVEFSNRYVITDNGDGTSDLNRDTGDVYAEGTNVVAEYLNNMESGISANDTGLATIGKVTSSTILSTAWTSESGGYYNEIAISGLEIGDKLELSMITSTYYNDYEFLISQNLRGVDCVTAGQARVHITEQPRADITVEIRRIEV